MEDNGDIVSKTIPHTIKVNTKRPKLGILFVGWGGNNGSTLTSGILANNKKLTFRTKTGMRKSNYFGSLTQSVTTKVGIKYNKNTNKISDVYRVIKDIVPLARTEEIVVGGWDISRLNMY